MVNYFSGFLFIILALAISVGEVRADVVPDSGNFSLDTKANKSGNTINITGGTKAKVNLFHSFSELSVANEKVLVFMNNDSQIQNVIGRITGSSESSILGNIQSGGTSQNFNLFLFNPNGIFFGPGSKVSLNGSFIVSTANAIQFGNQGIFSTLPTENLSLLSINPSALLFRTLDNQNNPNDIGKIKSIGAEFSLGQLNLTSNLLIVGKDLVLNSSLINSPDGQVDVVGADNRANVQLLYDENKPKINISSQFPRADVKLTGTLLNVSGSGTGVLNILARNMTLDAGSALISAHGPDILPRTGDKGFIFLDAKGTIALREGSSVISGIFTNTDDVNTGDGADIQVNAESLSLSSQSLLESSSIGNGSPGNIKITTDGSVILSQESAIDITSSRTTRSNNRSTISIDADSLALSEGSFINALTQGLGSGGNIHIIADKSVSLSGNLKNSFTQIRTTVEEGGIADAGSINIRTESLSLKGGAQLLTQVSKGGIGKGGDIHIFSTKSLDITGTGVNGFSSGLIAVAESGANGPAGSINVMANHFNLTNGAILTSQTFSSQPGGDITVNTREFRALSGGQVLANTFNTGIAGKISINAAESIVLKGSDPNFAQRVNLRRDDESDIQFLTKIGSASGFFAGTLGQGKGGDVSIFAPRLKISDGAVVDVRTTTDGEGGSILAKANSFTANNGGQLVSTTEGSNSAGNITLVVRDSISLNGKDSGIFANTIKDSAGPGGNINIDPKLVLLQNGAEIAVNSEGNGPAGSIALQSDNLTLDSGTISARSNSNTGGDISLSIADALLLRNNSQISTTAAGDGTGGRININADFIIAAPTENSDITADALNGPGGQIAINSKGIVGLKVREQNTNFSDITAISKNNPQLNGTVNINTPETDPSDNLSEQPETVEPPQDIAQGCRPGQALGGSTFVNIGRGGLPQGPQEAQTPPSLWQDLRAHNLQPSTTAPTPTSLAPPPEIVEAKGWAKDTQGRIYLTASAPQPSPNPLQPTPTC